MFIFFAPAFRACQRHARFNSTVATTTNNIPSPSTSWPDAIWSRVKNIQKRWFLCAHDEWNCAVWGKKLLNINTEKCYLHENVQVQVCLAWNQWDVAFKDNVRVLSCTIIISGNLAGPRFAMLCLGVSQIQSSHKIEMLVFDHVLAFGPTPVRRGQRPSKYSLFAWWDHSLHGASWQFQKFDCLSTKLYTLHSTLNNLHSRLYAPTLQHHNAPTRQDSTSTLYISHSTLNTLHTQHSTHSLLHNSPYISMLN